MLRRIVGWIILVPLCLALIVFALANRQTIVLNFNPFVPAEAANAPGIGVPLFLVLFTVLLFGVLLGGVSTWFAQSQHRRGERTWRRESERLNRELAAIRRSPAISGPAIDDLVKS
ncbi:MAG: lipopolysaccharide assembly protein LapA domain-containing protein [Devosia sp.]